MSPTTHYPGLPKGTPVELPGGQRGTIAWVNIGVQGRSGRYDQAMISVPVTSDPPHSRHGSAWTETWAGPSTPSSPRDRLNTRRLTRPHLP